jgi:hypothetical protein
MFGTRLASQLNLTASAVSQLVRGGRNDPVSIDIATELFE